MQRMYGLSMAWHWQFVCGHVHSTSHYGTILFLVHVIEIACVCLCVVSSVFILLVMFE